MVSIDFEKCMCILHSCWSPNLIYLMSVSSARLFRIAAPASHEMMKNSDLCACCFAKFCHYNHYKEGQIFDILHIFLFTSVLQNKQSTQNNFVVTGYHCALIQVRVNSDSINLEKGSNIIRKSERNCLTLPQVDCL